MFIRSLINFLFDLKAEAPGSGDGAPGNGQGGAPSGGKDGGQADPQAGGGGAGTAKPGAPDAGAGAGSGAPGTKATPKYGRYGDTLDPDVIWKDHQALVGKTTQTEKQAAALRKSLEAMGFRAVEDGQGGFRFEEIAKPAAKTEKTKRFTDQHKQFFDEQVLQAIQLLIEDIFEERIEKSFSEYENKGTQRQKMMQQKIAAGQKLVKLYPVLVQDGQDGKPNPEFNQEFYDRATEIWKGNKAYLNHPQGELFAAMEAAAEMSIAPSTIAGAKKAGFEEGVAGKKILGPAGGAGQPAGSGGKKTLSREEYLALTPEKREEYDKQQLGVTK